MKMRGVFWLIAGLTLVGCGRESSNQSESGTRILEREALEDERVVILSKYDYQMSQKRRIDLARDYSNVTEFEANLNVFDIEFKTNNPELDQVRVECNKFVNSRTVARLRNGTFSDQGVFSHKLEFEASDPGKIKLQCLIYEGESLAAKYEQDFLRSYMIHGNVDFTSFIGHEEIDYLVLMADSELSFGNNDTDLKVNNLISAGGRVVNMTKSQAQRTVDNRSGLHGASIRMSVDQARGVIGFTLRGGDAGKVTVLPAPMDKIPPRDPKLNGPCKDSRGKDCPGKKGHRGYPGNDGANGLNGGSSGSLRIEIKENDLIRISVSYEPGKGSAGVEGGKGGRGGPGGLGGKQYIESPTDRTCPMCFATENELKQVSYRVIQHPNGPEGDVGPDGEKGKDGDQGKCMDSYVGFTTEDMQFQFNSNWTNKL